MRLVARMLWKVPAERTDLKQASERLVHGLSPAVECRTYHDIARFEGVIPIERPEYQEIRKLIDHHQLWHTHSIHPEFTDEERTSAEMLNFFPNAYISETNPEESWTRFERITLCPNCRLSTRKQLTPLCLRGAQMEEGDIAMTLGDDITVVNQRLADLMRRHEITGCELHPVRSLLGSLLPFFQIVPAWTLPDLDETTPFITDEKEFCSHCQRMGRVPAVLRYRRSELGPIQDVGFAPVYYSMNPWTVGQILISRRFHDLMQQHGIKGYLAEPVQVIDD